MKGRQYFFQKKSEARQVKIDEVPPRRIKGKKKFFLSSFTHLFFVVINLVSFMLLLSLYILNLVCTECFRKLGFLPQSIKSSLQRFFTHFYIIATGLLDKQTDSVSRIDLISLSLRNLRAKKTRTIVTIGGMAIGIGSIVFLVSLGYGLQRMVIARVASLDEMRQADVSVSPGSTLKINNEILAKFSDITHVRMVLPLISVVGKVEYQSSQSDIAVYGVTSDYLKESAIKPIKGSIFTNNDLALGVAEGESVKGVTQERQENDIVGISGETISEVTFSINQGSWVRVRENSTVNAKVLGYTKRSSENQKGERVWGGSYLSDDRVGESGVDSKGEKLGAWIKAPVLLWEKKTCDKDLEDGCEEGAYMILKDEEGKQVQKVGYFAELNMEVSPEINFIPEKLVLSASDSASGSLDFVTIASESGTTDSPETVKKSLHSKAIREAVINTAMVDVLGLSIDNAVGKTFKISFIATGDLLQNPNERIESVPSEYKIVGIIADETTPFVYVPFMDLSSLGITNYSQVKVVASTKNDLATVRRNIEATGFATMSVSDTVEQINNLFATLRTMLMLLGMVALAVAAIGMFNTLTVSLLERTREIGIMKAMGMRSEEVKELFLTESMIMGLFGGLLGLFLGFVAGKMVSLILSFFAFFKGVGFLDISYIPFSLVIIIIIISLCVGLLTGFYPAARATKISALNALRYE